MNHRYLDLNIKLPEALVMLETDVRAKLKHMLVRGKVECVLKMRPDPDGEAQSFHLNESLVQGIANAATQLAQHDMIDGRLRAADLLRWPGVIANSQESLVEQKGIILDALAEALDQFIQHRAQEGQALAATLVEKLDDLSQAVQDIEGQLPALLRYQEEKLRSRLAELEQATLEPGRLEQELVFLMQRLDIEEELTRLKTHINKVKDTINHPKTDNSVGKMLDFYMQELNREANTICSKSQNAKITQNGVDLKITIEQMREQIQNIQ